jgi:hypothetical protein
MVLPSHIFTYAWVAAAGGGGENVVWTGRLAMLVAMFLVVGRRVQRSWSRRKNRAQQTDPVIPTHPVILQPKGPLGWADQIKKPVLPIAAVRELLGPSPRQFSSELQKYLAVTPPGWLKRQPKDELQLAFKNQIRIRREGAVMWAAIVQANSLLFRRGPTDCPASVIFSHDPWYDDHAEELLQTAHELYQLKGTDQNDADAAAFARMLTNELTRGMMLRVPKRFTGGRNVFHSAIMLPRKHLPKGYLAGSLFPVWADPGGTGALLLVPAAYWPPSLTAAWDRPARAKV